MRATSSHPHSYRAAGADVAPPRHISSLMRRLRIFLLHSVLARLVLALLLGYSLLRRRRILCVTASHGQLGNRLFLTTHLVATALQHRLELINLGFLEYAPLFQASSEDPHFRFPRRPQPLLSRWPALRHVCRELLEAAGQRIPPNQGSGLIRQHRLGEPESILDCNSAPFRDALLQSRVIFLHGWSYRNHEQVALHADAIRRHLLPRPEIAASCWELGRTLRAGLDILIGIHIRQGDYRTARDGELYYSTAQYVTWMRMLPERFPGQRVGFFIASNERQDTTLFTGLDCRAIPQEEMHRIGDSPIRDMTLLSQCDYILGPPSSFSGWASFTGQVPIHFLRGDESTLSLEDFKVSLLRECKGW